MGLFSFQKSKGTIIGYVVAVCAIILVAGLKTQGSTDYLSYKNEYLNSSIELTLDSAYEPGFLFVKNVCRSLNFSFILFYFLFACVSIGMKAFVFNKLTPYAFPALLIYLCGLFFERDNDGIRQGMSIAFCFLSLYYIINNNKKGVVISYAIAVLFHYSSFVFVIALLFDKIKLKDKVIAITVLVFFVLCAMHMSFSDMLMSYLPTEMSMTKMEQYSNSEEYSANVGISVGLLFRMGVLMLFMRQRYKMAISERMYLIFRNGFALSIIMSLAFNDFIILSHRLPYVFREFQIFIVPYLFTSVRKQERPLYIGIVWLYCCMLLYRFLNGDASAVYNSYENYLFSF